MKKILSLISTSYKKDLKNYLSYKFNFFGEVLMSFIIVFFILYISKVYQGSESIFLERYDNNYFLFLLTGLSLLMFTTRVFSVIPFMITTSQTNGYFEDLISAEININWILLTSIFFPLLQAIIRLFFLFFFSLIFSDTTLSFLDFFEMIVLLLLTSFPFIGISLIVGSIVIAFKKASFVSSLFLLGCTIFSGIFYPVDVMPDSLQTLSVIFPSTFSVEVIRSIIVSNESYYSNLDIFVLIFIQSVGYILLGLNAVKLALISAKKKGTTAHF